MRYWLFIFLTISAVSAATYWADNTVTDSSTYDPATRTVGSGDQTVRNTIQEAVNLATTPGDIVEVREGTYDEAVASASAGAESNYIIHRAYNGERVETRRWDQNSGDEDHNYNWMEGFILSGTSGADGNDAALRIRSSYNVFTNNILTNTTRHYGVYVTGGTNLFIGNKVDAGPVYVGKHDGGDNQLILTDSDQTMIPDILVGEKVYNWDGERVEDGPVVIGTITANTETTITATLAGGTDNDWDDGDGYVAGNFWRVVFNVNGNGNIFEGNTFTNMGDCERVWSFAQSDYTVVRGNIINGMIKSGADGGVHQDLFQVGSTATTKRFITIEHNQFLDCLSQGSNIEGDETVCNSWIVRGNVWKYLDAQWGPKVKASKYYNNTIYMTGGTYPFGFWNDADSEVFNNIFVGATSTALSQITDDPGAFDVNNNYYATGLDWTAWDPAYLSTTLGDDAPVNGGDPMMTDPENDDFTLQEGSPLINAGRDLSVEWPDAVDINGNPMGAGGGWDIGAFEFTTDGGGSSGGSDGGTDGTVSPTVKGIPFYRGARRR